MLRTLFLSLGLLILLGSCTKETADVYYTLKIVPESGGSVSNTGYPSIPGATVTLTGKAGTSVTIQAFAEEGYQFDGWSDGKTTNPYTLVLDRNINLEAYFLSN
jgi:hypothetical protein